MGRNRTRFLIIISFLFVSTVSAYSQNQMTFELEGDVSSPVTVPQDVIAVLKSDRVVDGCFKTAGAGVNESEWFAASEFDLNSDGRRDLIIKPKHSCLFGANQGPFWVFQNARDGYQKVLTANGLKLTINPSRVNSYNTIDVSRVAGMKGQTTKFRFSQGKYRPGK